MEESRFASEMHVFKQKNRRVLLIFNYLKGFTYNLLFTLIEPYLYSLVASEKTVGMIKTIGTLAMFFPQLWAGKYSDKKGRIICMNIGLIFMILAMINLSYFTQLIFSILGITLFYFGFGISDPAFNNLINENKPEGKTASSFGLMYFLYFAGSVSANALIDILGESFSYEFYFQIFLIIALVQLVAQNMLLREKPKETHSFINSESDTENHPNKIGNNLKEGPSIWAIIFHNPFTRNMIIYLTLDGLIWGSIFATYYAGLMANFSLQKGDIARLALVFNLFNMLFQLPAGHITDKIGSVNSLMISASLGLPIFGCIIISWFIADSWYFIFLMAGQVFFAMSVAMYVPSNYTLLTNFSKDRNAEIYGAINSIKGIGILPTGIIGGFLMEDIHFLAPFFVGLVLIPAEVAFIYFFIKKKPFSSMSIN